MVNGTCHHHNCLNHESFRQELIENCNGSISIAFCCCEALITEPAMNTARATLIEVGKDFIVLNVTQMGVFQHNSLIPIQNIAFFTERPPHVEVACHCNTDRKFNETIASFCGQSITVEACFCGIPRLHAVINGTLVEVGKDFIELHNPQLIQGNTPLATINPANNLVIFLDSICRIQHPPITG